MVVARPATWIAFILSLVVAGEALAAAALAGKVENLKGTVAATGSDGQVRRLKEGKPVFEGDRIDTFKRALVALEFKDGTKFQLGEDSSMSVDEFVFGTPEDDTFSAKVLKGAFRFITGLVADKKPSSMNVALGITATIGIRGTNVGGELVGEKATVVLLEPEEPEKTAIEVFNEHGTVTIDEPGFGTVVPDSRSAPTPAQRMRLRTIDNLMRSLQSISRGLTRPSPSLY